MGLPAPALPPTYDEPAGRSPWLGGFPGCPGKVPPHPTGRRDRAVLSIPVRPPAGLGLGPSVSPTSGEAYEQPRPCAGGTGVACVLCCLAPRWPSLPLTLRTGAQPGRGRWRQGLRGCPTPSQPQRPSSGPWGAGDELATGEQGQGLPSSPGHGAGAASSGQCCCAFKDRHVMRGQWSPASHCPLPQAGPLVTLGFDYFISNAILAVGTRFPQNCSRAVFTEIKARTDPGSGTLPHGLSSLRPLLRF